MKTVLRLTALLCLPLFFSCSRQSQAQNENPADYLTQGQWKVREFIAGTAQSGNLTACNIRFSGNGTLTCTVSGQEASGTWSVHQKVEGKCIDLHITGSVADAAALNNQWDLRYFDASTVKMEQGSSQLALGRP